MQVIRGNLRAPPMGCLLGLVLWLAACGGGGGDDDREATPSQVEAHSVVVLEVDSSDAQEGLLLDAAREHGAPGENEQVHYRIHGGNRSAAHAAVATLRDNGFGDVELQ